MRHVDDGTIHAWLDGQVTDRAEAAWIDEHLQWCATCAARLAEERSVLEHAHALLASAAPAAEPPAFEDIVNGVARQDAVESPTAVRRVAGVRHLRQLAWAASLVLAAGLGWLARDMASDGTGSLDVTSVAETPSTSPAASAPEPPPSPGIAGSAAARLQAEVPPPAAPQTTAGAPETMQRARREGVAAEIERPTAAAASTPTSEFAASIAQRGEAVAAPPARTGPREEARRVLGGAVADATAEATVKPAPAAVPLSPPAPEPSAITAAAPQVVGVPGGLLQTRPEAAAGAASGWRTLPRTEAAVRSGMALYGLDGMEPVLTAISPDNSAVRTVYPLPTGGTIELLQERASAPAAAAAAQSAARAVASDRASVVANLAPAPGRTWSGVRGDVRLSLRTASNVEDVNALATRLKVE
jgi:hypothetical protein